MSRRSGLGFSSRLHDERVAATLGLGLGVTFGLCFVTGLISHAIQHPPSWFTWPPRPVNLYRVTQGIHVLSGIASIPLLLAKLWVVYPKLWTWPPARDVAHAIERITLVPLIGGGLFLVFTGVINIQYWYSPMPFFFPPAHHWAAWITIGALIVHVTAKGTATRRLLLSPAPVESAAPEGLSRRGFLGAVFAGSGALVLAVAGDTVAPLHRLAVLAPRSLEKGTQGLPVNRSAAQARVAPRALDPDYRLVVEGRVPSPLQLSLADLRAMPQHEAGLPISCVEGWSAAAHWRGVPVRDLLGRAGVTGRPQLRVVSLETDNLYAVSEVNSEQVGDRDLLLALELNGEPLHLDHGFPVRLIGPARPGVAQTKWVGKVIVL